MVYLLVMSCRAEGPGDIETSPPPLPSVCNISFLHCSSKTHCCISSKPYIYVHHAMEVCCIVFFLYWWVVWFFYEFLKYWKIPLHLLPWLSFHQIVVDRDSGNFTFHFCTVTRRHIAVFPRTFQVCAPCMLEILKNSLTMCSPDSR